MLARSKDWDRFAEARFVVTEKSRDYQNERLWNAGGSQS